MFGRDRSLTTRNVLVTPSGQFFGQSSRADAALNDRLFYCNTATVVACSTTLNTTFTGLLIGNPTTSGKWYVFHEFGWAASGAVAGESILSLAIGDYGNATAQRTIKTAKAGGLMLSEALADEAVTLTAAPVVCKTVTELREGIDTVQYGSQGPNVIDLNGSIIVAPGYAIMTDSTVGTGAVMSFHFMWEEIDI
jgi:hypothetical protein